MRYAGFWQRFGAYWIDALILLPLSGLAIFFGEKSRLFLLYWFVPGLALGLFYQVYLVRRYGGTPGKLLLKTRIAMQDGAPVTMKAAVLRHAVLFILSALLSVAMLIPILQMTDANYFSYTYITRSVKLVEMAPSWYYPVAILLQIWIWGEFVTMLFNKRRRAVHDFIAGTVVVRTAA
jgi:uncharacterized RDD family membrane protein YckC